MQRAVGLVISSMILVFGTGCERRERVNTKAQPGDVTPAGAGDPTISQAAALKALGAGIRDEGVLVEVAERALPAVVSVTSTRLAREMGTEPPFDSPLFRRFFAPDSESPFPLPPGRGEQHGLGSGVVVGANLVLTNAHVVDGADRLEVRGTDKRVFTTEVVGTDPKSDLALLRVKGDTSGLRPIEFADSSSARLGQIVLAIGNPFGVGQTVTMGIVSAKGRANLGIVAYEDFIQTDAAINPGNSGGALVDMNGRLIGIPTAILSRTGGYMGVGFAIPSNMAKPIMTSLLEHGRVVRGYLGVAIQEIDQDIAEALALPNTNGVLVSDVSPTGPAARAGLRRGDVILSINGMAVGSTGELRNIIAAAGVGKTVKLEVLRGKARRSIDVQLAETPKTELVPGAPAEERAAPAAGLSLAPLDATLRNRLNVPREVRNGLVVTDVAPESPAARAGIQPGDVIVEVDRQPVESAAKFGQLWSRAKGPVAVLLFRDGRASYVALPH